MEVHGRRRSHDSRHIVRERTAITERVDALSGRQRHCAGSGAFAPRITRSRYSPEHSACIVRHAPLLKIEFRSRDDGWVARAETALSHQRGANGTTSNGPHELLSPLTADRAAEYTRTTGKLLSPSPVPCAEKVALPRRRLLKTNKKPLVRRLAMKGATARATGSWSAGNEPRRLGKIRRQG